MPTVAYVLGRHVVDAADLYDIRRALSGSPHITLADLGQHDGRIAAHVDALFIAADEAWRYCQATLEAPTSGAMFAATLLAIEARDDARLSSLFAVAQALPEVQCGVTAAFGWLAPEQLQGVVVQLLGSSDPFRRRVGLAACRMHGVDPGRGLAGVLRDGEVRVRGDGLRLAGELGRVDLELPVLDEQDDELRFWHSWAAVLLGRTALSLRALSRIGLERGPQSWRACRLALQAMDLAAGHGFLKAAAACDTERRRIIMGAGVVGDPAYAPWLIKQMAEPAVARSAGEAFTTITGIDFLELALDRPKPEGADQGPNDDPDDPNVDMDPDEGLPWPDPDKVQAWWDNNASRFQPGVRYFMGAPVTREHCIEVLKNGYQRQRILAAHYLCLLDPGTPLFNTSAPAWRQQKLLAQMA